jgi:hypothetical protein
LLQVEAQNFEDIDEAKLTQDSDERVEFIIRDYFMSVVVRYILDDLSQVMWLVVVIVVLANHRSNYFLVSILVNEDDDLNRRTQTIKFISSERVLGLPREEICNRAFSRTLCGEFFYYFDFCFNNSNCCRVWVLISALLL